MKTNELKEIYGGVSFSASLLNYLIKGITSIFEIGRRIGSALVRYKTNTPCSAK